MKRISLIIIIVLSASFLLLSCQKAKETEKKEIQEQVEKQQTSPQLTKEEIKISPLTEQEQKEFDGGWMEPGNITQKKAFENLRILVKGNHETIRWYRVHMNEYPGMEMKELYQYDIYSMIRALAQNKNKAGYDLVCQVIEKKSGYPKARAWAAEAIGWYGDIKNGKWCGDKRAIPVLKEVLNDKDPEVRLQAAGTLLTLGEADIALPVLDDLVKLGIHQSTFALNKLFAVEEFTEDGKKRLVISHTKLWDERGKSILEKALDYQGDEVKAFAAVSLAQMGKETGKTEKVSLQVVEKLRNRTIRDYGFDFAKGVPTTDPKAEPYYSDGRSCTHAMYALQILKSKEAIPLLEYITQNNKEWWFVCDSKEAAKALDEIREYGRTR